VSTPTDQEIVHALENTVNVAAWIHIDHNPETSSQRVSVLLYDGNVIVEEDAFISYALLAVEARLPSRADYTRAKDIEP
jgi:hypothetical protein